MHKNLKNCKKLRKEALAASAMRDAASNDVLGSYTGTARDGGPPDQDADDL